MEINLVVGLMTILFFCFCECPIIAKNNGMSDQEIGLLLIKIEEYQKAENHLEVIKLCKQGIRLNPDYGLFYSYLGKSYLALKRYQEAVKAFERAKQLRPDMLMIDIFLGLAYLSIGRYQESVEKLKEAIHKYPDMACNYNFLGRAYFQLITQSV